MKILTALLALLLPAIAATAAAPRVLIISVDGLRPDLILRADMPNVRSLMTTGSFSLWALTTPAAITMPSHASMLTGVTIERHGITANAAETVAKQTLKAKTVFEYARAAGLSTGMAAGKRKFRIVEKDVDWPWVPPTESTTDEDVTDHALQIIGEHRPRLMLYHLPRNDHYGHSIGWGSPEQLAALANTDKQIGRVFDALKEARVWDQTTIILSADHGGSGRSHGAGDYRSLQIPWLVAGTGVRANFDLTRDPELIISTYDTFATALHVLGIEQPAGIDGKPILLAFEQADLLQTAPASSATTRPATTQP